VALRNEMDLSIAIALESSTQVWRWNLPTARDRVQSAGRWGSGTRQRAAANRATVAGRLRVRVQQRQRPKKFSLRAKAETPEQGRQGGSGRSR
jgi:hypothetical protein